MGEIREVLTWPRDRLEARNETRLTALRKSIDMYDSNTSLSSRPSIYDAYDGLGRLDSGSAWLSGAWASDPDVTAGTWSRTNYQDEAVAAALRNRALRLATPKDRVVLALPDPMAPVSPSPVAPDLPDSIATELVPNIDWSALSVEKWSWKETLQAAARTAVRWVPVFFSGSGADADYDRRSPLGQQLIGLGFPPEDTDRWVKDLIRQYAEQSLLPIVQEMLNDGCDDFHVLGLYPTIPQSPYREVTTDIARAKAAMPSGGALYAAILRRGDLLGAPDDDVFWVSGQLAVDAVRIA